MNDRQFSDPRVEPYQSDSHKDFYDLTSPSGIRVARMFALDGHIDTAAEVPVYPLEDRRRIVSQIRIALEEFYVHLAIKRAQYGLDLTRALERLEPVLATLTDDEFHQSLVQLIPRMRDRHLTFYGRSPNGLSASLPLLIERCWVGEVETYVVTAIEPNYSFKHLEVGAFVTHWNGIPIDRYVRLNANILDGGNEAASIARSLEFLSIRSLSSNFLRRFALPLESWVDLRFKIDDDFFEERFQWQGFDIGELPATPPIGRNIVGFGGDSLLMESQSTRRAVFARDSFDAPPALKVAGGGTPTIIGRTNNFDFGSVVSEHGTFAYIRLFHFRADGVDDIANDFIAAFERMPRQGLVIDMRGNAGGYIAAGERLLQLFTPNRIVPTRFQFRATDGVRAIMDATSSFDRWKSSVEEAQLTGEPFSQGYPIEGTDEDANQVGQLYFGPVVVVTDALAFSTADMFVAGFIDHQIGRIISIDRNVAAAGANNWQFEVLRLFIPTFKTQSAFESELDNGVLSPEFKAAFNGNGVSLSNEASIVGSGAEYGGKVWRIGDGSLQHLVRALPWMNGDLNVYPATGAVGLQELPAGVSFGLSIRRCIRTGVNEGRLLEDLGISPDVEYKLTLRDVLESNEDLLTRATLELSQMPVHDLAITTSSTGDGTLISCSTKDIAEIEVYERGRHFASFTVTDSQLEFEVPTSVPTVELKGFHGDSLVARRIVNLEH